MTNRKLILFTGTLVSLIILLIIFMRVSTCNHTISIIPPAFEIEPKFVLTPNGDIVFSATDDNTYSIYKYTSKGLQKKDHGDGYLSPFMIDNRVYGLIDNNGDQNYITDHVIIKKLVAGRFIRYLQAFANTDQVVVQLNNDNTVYLLDISEESKTVMLNGVRKVHNILKVNGNSFIINYDGTLSIFNLQTKSEQVLTENINGESMNAYVTEELFLYYANQNEQDHYKILEINLKIKPLKSRVIHEKRGFDVRMPKRKGDFLYFLELVNSEYLLYRMNLRTKTLKQITRKGVVYMYDFGPKNNIVLSYSDFEHPKCIADYDIKNEKFTIKTGSRQQLPFTYQPLKSKYGSNAYLIKPKNNLYKGVIVYFHPGLHSDFSPRWDPIIINLVINGYVILAPNYPMSSGYGQRFYQSDLKIAAEDIGGWKNYIRANFKPYPMYYLSSSSGNILMEKSLKDDDEGVSAFASLFGISVESEKFSKKEGLYILGENDPIVNFQTRKQSIMFINGQNKVISYPTEGHWIRNQTNNEDLVKKIINFYCDRKPFLFFH